MAKRCALTARDVARIFDLPEHWVEPTQEEVEAKARARAERAAFLRYVRAVRRRIVSKLTQ